MNIPSKSPEAHMQTIITGWGGVAMALISEMSFLSNSSALV